VRDSWRFHGLLALFMVSMVGLVTAQDLVVLFVFWDLTAVASWLLVGFDRHEREARIAALMALIVTGVSAIALLVAAVLLFDATGTFSIPAALERAEPGTTLTITGALVLVAGLAKAAQVPLHFWLPRAMAAPTPVSAYLHSAAMVAAGVFLLSRFYPIVQTSGVLLDALLVVGLASVAIGGVISLTRDTLKQVLAYSTVSQYGYVVFMLGLGGAEGAVAASFYVVAHALAKCALFLTAGAVTTATGAKRLSETGGLGRAMPLLAVGSALAAAALAALPLTLGFFKDELLFAAALERGTPFALCAVAAAALTFAYVGRFWAGLFLGPLRARPTAAWRALTVPVLVLGVAGALGGVWVAPVLGLADAAGSDTLGALASAEAAYHLDLRAENLMALGAYATGALLLAAPRAWRPAAAWVARAGERLGPERGYVGGLRGLNRLSDAIHDVEVRDLRARIATVLVPAAGLVLAAVVLTPTVGAFTVGSVTADDVPLALALGVAALAAVGATVPRDHLTLVLILSTLGFSLAVSYAFFGAPNVALVAVLVESVLALLFLAVFSLLPREVLRREAALRPRPLKAVRNGVIAVVSGLAAFAVVWAALSRPAPGTSAADELLARTPDAHASNAVTAILADFRGLDTLVEITVVLVALVGIAGLLRRARSEAAPS
jgi:multicomponent Na+:H+ antiporter subunit A